MQAYGGGKAADQYLIQRIQGASPEMLAALLLEGGQKFVNLALVAMKNRDIPGKARYVNRTSDIIEELSTWLNQEEGGEVVVNLMRIYDWWMNELFEGAQQNQPERLELIGRQMGEMRGTWEELHLKNRRADQPGGPTASLDGLMG
jgi:flagellar secretion chaperone FliS